jgi:hypothetical protein
MRVSNIYKLSPELYGMVSSSVLEDAEATSDKVPPPDGPLQTQANVNPSLMEAQLVSRHQEPDMLCVKAWKPLAVIAASLTSLV